MTKETEALKLAQKAMLNSNSISYEMLNAIAAIKEALAQPEERNFCPRCGKRTADLTTIHTCTPPQPEQELVATVIKRGGYRQWHCLALSQLPDGTYTFYGERSQRTPPQIDPNQWAFDRGLEST
jgi:hypothetical protein